MSLDRGAIKLDLGDFQCVALSGNQVLLPEADDRVIARHIHNRWISDQHDRQSFMTLNIAGPLVVSAHDDRDVKLGPYYVFSMTDGVLYVDQRVFGLWDAQKKDWYLKDTSHHCKRFRILFVATD